MMTGDLPSPTAVKRLMGNVESATYSIVLARIMIRACFFLCAVFAAHGGASRYNVS